MGVEHREFPIYGVQFHPESIGTPVGKSLLRNFLRPVVPPHHELEGAMKSATPLVSIDLPALRGVPLIKGVMADD
jgi:hypothetical protein